VPTNPSDDTRLDDPLAGLPDLATLATFGADLRQVPIDAENLEAAVNAATTRLTRIEAAGSSQVALDLLGYVGNGLRILGRLDQAVMHLERAVALARRLNRPKAEVANLIRLGEAHRNADDYAAAEPCFRAALDRIRDERDDLRAYENFALQHLGKCLIDAGRAVEAISCLERALALRHAKGDADLIASTEVALAQARDAAGLGPTHERPNPRLWRFDSGKNMRVVDEEAGQRPEQEEPEPPRDDADGERRLYGSG
jgi:tetratricopeptide (TPR) repeat protein